MVEFQEEMKYKRSAELNLGQLCVSSVQKGYAEYLVL